MPAGPNTTHTHTHTHTHIHTHTPCQAKCSPGRSSPERPHSILTAEYKGPAMCLRLSILRCRPADWSLLLFHRALTRATRAISSRLALNRKIWLSTHIQSRSAPTRRCHPSTAPHTASTVIRCSRAPRRPSPSRRSTSTISRWCLSFCALCQQLRHSPSQNRMLKRSSKSESEGTRRRRASPRWARRCSHSILTWLFVVPTPWCHAETALAR